MIKQNDLWVEKYRPTSIEDFVGNEQLKEKIKNIIVQQNPPNLILSGPPGTGKTSIINLIVKSGDFETMELKAAEENKKEDILKKVVPFASTRGQNNRLKLCIIHEANFIDIRLAQPALFDIIERSSNRCRYLLTTNYEERIMEQIQSRCQSFNVTPPDISNVAKHCYVNILQKEKVKAEIKDVAYIVEKHFPDIRKVIGTLQQQTINNVLQLDKQSLAEANFKENILNILIKEKSKTKAFNQIRQLVANVKLKDFMPMIRFLYDNVDKLSIKDELRAAIILVLAETQLNDTIVVDKEINMMSGFIKLLEEIK